MLRGIDISNWQAGIDLNAVFPHVDFVICKATEGTGFVDPYCDGWVQQCIQAGKRWGFYHFAGEASATDEALYYITHTENYFGYGVPILDWETTQGVNWINTFVSTVHAHTGVWPWVYGNPWRFNQGGVEPKCGRWVASYPRVTRPTLDYDPGEPPATDGLVCCWQYASDGLVPGYDGNLDVNHFFGDERAWDAYAGRTSAPEPEPTSQSVLENEDYRVEITRKS